MAASQTMGSVGDKGEMSASYNAFLLLKLSYPVTEAVP